MKNYYYTLNEYGGEVYATSYCKRCRSGWGQSNCFDANDPNAKVKAIKDLHAQHAIGEKKHRCLY